MCKRHEFYSFQSSQRTRTRLSLPYDQIRSLSQRCSLLSLNFYEFWLKKGSRWLEIQALEGTHSNLRAQESVLKLDNPWEMSSQLWLRRPEPESQSKQVDVLFGTGRGVLYLLACLPGLMNALWSRASRSKPLLFTSLLLPRGNASFPCFTGLT